MPSHRTEPPAPSGRPGLAARPRQDVDANPDLGRGLSSGAARALLRTSGPNAIPEERASFLQRLARSLWQPVPWMLEATILLQLVLGERLEALIIALLLAFNSIPSLAQEGRSEKALELLKQRLAPSALVLRDGVWKVLSAAEIVPGDVVKLSLGGIVPADACLLEGAVLLDQSMLTGESAAVEASAGSKAFAGALVRRGEAAGRVAATGARTFYGRTAALVQIAHAESSEQKAVLGMVRNITVINGGILAAITGYAHALGLPTVSLIQLVLTAILASIPVALPATFTLAAALAAQALAHKGVLLTRLAAVHEAASVDTLCSDKTGTLTRNDLDVAAVVPAVDVDRKGLLRLAAAASSEASGDPVDAAIRAAAAREEAIDGRYHQVSFTPFDPALKQARAVVETHDRRRLQIAKGAFEIIARENGTPPQLRETAEALEENGHRVLGVAVGGPPSGRVVGLLGLRDPPREDAAELITQLSHLGVRTVMVTGDAPRTARAIAAEVGLGGPAITGEAIGDDMRSQDIGVVAGVLPEQKFRLVRALQRQGHIVGMCGDGANDAPALRQAQFGVAVASATDIAKSAAAVVLTVPGLAGIVEAIREGRRVHQRVTTYALNAIIKKIELVPLLALGLVITGQPVLTPLLMILLLVAGDFLTMAVTADRVRGAPRPVGWDNREMIETALLMGLVKLGFTTSVILTGRDFFALDIAALQTLAFVTLVFGGQAVVYVVRERSWLWSSLPSTWLLLASAVDLGLAAALAGSGALMKPLPALALVAVALATTAFALLLDVLKVRLMRTLVRL